MSRGRPRDPAVERKVLQVTLEHLARFGYSEMSLDQIVAEAGVSKPALYRRWKSKAELAVAAMEQLRGEEPVAESGEVRQDLVQLLRNFQTSLVKTRGVPWVLRLQAERETLPQLLELFRERVVAQRRALFRRALEAARERGEIKAEADLEVAISCLIGSYYARYVADEEPGEDWPERAVDALLMGLRAPTR